jgi:hypothetical protein
MLFLLKFGKVVRSTSMGAELIVKMILVESEEAYAYSRRDRESGLDRTP